MAMLGVFLERRKAQKQNFPFDLRLSLAFGFGGKMFGPTDDHTLIGTKHFSHINSFNPQNNAEFSCHIIAI